MIPIGVALHSLKEKLPEPSNTYYVKFQKDSVCRFFLSSKFNVGRILVCLTICFQLWVTSVFINAADQRKESNDWACTLSCPENSIECIDQRLDKIASWLTFSVILAFFVISDVLDGFYLFYRSCTLRRIDAKGSFLALFLHRYQLCA